MASDLESKKKADRTVPKNASAEILDQEIREGRTAIEASTVRLFLSGLSAGLDIGFSPFLSQAWRSFGERSLSERIVRRLVDGLVVLAGDGRARYHQPDCNRLADHLGDRFRTSATRHRGERPDVRRPVRRAIAPADFGHFILWATLGNIVGGSVFVALIKYSHAGWADE